MPDRRIEDLQAFVVECIESFGGVVEFPEYGLAEALLPDAAAAAFGGRTFLQIAFDPEVAREHPDAELAVYGSEFVDRLIGLASGRGQTTVRHLYVDRLEVTRVAERLAEQFQFVHCAPSLEFGILRNFSYLLFHFKLIYLTDEREEAFYPVLVNLNTDRPVEESERFLHAAGFAPSRQAVCPEEPVCSVQAAYRTACAFLRQQADRAFRTKQEENRRRLDMDLRRIATYYDDLKEEAEGRIERSSDPERASALRHRIQLYEVERERRRKEIEDKYSLRMDVRLTSAELYVQPKVVNAVRVFHRDRECRVRFVWDPLLKAFEPPLCGRCGEELRTIAFDRDGQIACWGKGAKGQTRPQAGSIDSIGPSATRAGSPSTG